MKAGEIIRIIVLSIIGAVLMFLVQPWIYQNRLIRITDVPRIEAWVSNYYIPGATVVFLVSVVATLLWYVMAVQARVNTAGDTFRWQMIWWLFLLFPILSICVAIGFFGGSQDALLSLTGFLVFDGIFWLFWLPTATSSPASLMYIPPGSFTIRRVIGF
ncbi:MAG TPA: hypothetical protein DEG17_09565 [Cyanobacteria bacterium UBA11149]|nr:hypothetical protein [Cyanobacteria bacterium UBA11367]HBE57133.1 hypothetical protein [Cyanobacteria bacterium UBA11366]HBK64421.1 hypothetical protein [Cyanobacteria bacterium UBA11166]HBR75762.1 hypothetical protein [Cyanobacteria bacterium UBA11159]HBS69820.1 hypothetical protein [Cyanobacteria bacterium UBA11153]HBW89096.1 hypothetical protein [Cyanobacteria bacterium UBA11149]HCA96966.1 hypothetical protein [Cyanobacteria bacterium UBA9226]